MPAIHNGIESLTLVIKYIKQLTPEVLQTTIE